MKSKITAFLTYIFSFFLITASIFLPKIDAKADTITTSTIDPNYVSPIQATITSPSIVFSYSGHNPADHPLHGFYLTNINGIPYISSYLSFSYDLPNDASTSVSFSFYIDGIPCSGNLNLNIITLGGRHRSGEAPLSLFMPSAPSNPENLKNEENEFEKAFAKEIDNTIHDIELAIQGLSSDGSDNPAKTVEYNCPGAVHSSIINVMANAKTDVTLIYTYQYEGYIFQSRITPELAAKIYSDYIPWYGPCYIASNCPTVMIGVA